MKVEIENEIDIVDDDTIQLIKEFNFILKTCKMAKSKDNLRNLIDGLHFFYFVYGFTGSHFWCANKLNDKRVLFVPFEN